MRRIRRKQKTPEMRRRRTDRWQRIFQAAGRCLFAAILAAAALAALTVFFKVDTVSVEGAVRYTPEELVAGLDVQRGDNLYLWDKIKTTNDLLEKFPYLETVQIRRRLPGALVVTVTEESAAVAVPTNGVYYLLSAQGKVLEQTATDGGYPVVTGVTLGVIKPGQFLDAAQDTYTDALLTVLQTLDAADMLSQVDFINLQSLTDVRIGYQGRFDIRIGTVEQMAYRLRFAQTVINERLSPSDIGRLYWDAQKRLHYVPDTAENVAKSGIVSDTSADAADAAADDTAADDADSGSKDAQSGGEEGTQEN